MSYIEDAHYALSCVEFAYPPSFPIYSAPIDHVMQLPSNDASMLLYAYQPPTFYAPSSPIDIEYPPVVFSAPTTLYPPSPHLEKTKDIPSVCLTDGCHAPIPWRRGHCRDHGGVKKCGRPRCPRGPQRGGFCITHGGGRRCSMDGCIKAVQTAGLCKSHGGGIRCGADGCDKSSQGGGYCRKHGGGKRCQAIACDKGVQRGSFCAKHGGFQYCKVDGCHRTDRGGGCCDVHRKNLACAFSGCMRMARKQGLCVAHAKRYVTTRDGVEPRVVGGPQMSSSNVSSPHSGYEHSTEYAI
ncbi:hypothetical protein SPRG_13411 [Saprolegnia parasitica CBS 223.65]|uniref:WRKY19-like zinc finger domain-containing protein n=1 Tax=Saprolegnia parasitica (strain CBS 223.65) TaxID=695850 RepID=A0A067BQX3_SAPPC|nr:hypothetical protein SPRG_13411 [Saprolegnia parasitica CBS 223.65]KDO20658.1 hypothetical protein SPRG_13411 [Saprolegnia parasitica CBS 223.65]|eukprot:XP_012208624.1 hypothetical protein SPRG_13411 [Saprolegnia parasitica CBS 223.65]